MPVNFDITGGWKGGSNRSLVPQVRARSLGANLGGGRLLPILVAPGSLDLGPATPIRSPRRSLLAAHNAESCSIATLPHRPPVRASLDCDAGSVTLWKTRAHPARCGRSIAFARKSPIPSCLFGCATVWQTTTSDSESHRPAPERGMEGAPGSRPFLGR